MKFVSLLCALFFTTSGFAATQVQFSDDQATILIPAQPGDLDAAKLFDAIKTPMTESTENYEKQVEIKTSSGQVIFSVVCHLSKNANLGTCTIVVPKSEFASIDSSNQQVFLMFGFPESVPTANSFKVGPYGQVFTSADSRLGLFVDFAGAGQPFSFRLFYK